MMMTMYIKLYALNRFHPGGKQ